jgi:mannose-6-phosphate isomerase-like protein (cupin superfamily)
VASKIIAYSTGMVACLLVAVVLDSVVFRQGEADPTYYPPAGYLFENRSEGFRQTILGYDGDLAWTELVLLPGAAGPPEHVHTSFPEHFIVVEGVLSVMLNGEKRVVRAGESLLVAPGARHRPFNETRERVVVRGPLTREYALPKRFVIFLTQAYRFFDESEANSRPPAALLQMSLFSPAYDVWLAGPPIAIQRAAYALIRPVARLLGYRTHYEQYRHASAD